MHGFSNQGLQVEELTGRIEIEPGTPRDHSTIRIRRDNGVATLSQQLFAVMRFSSISIRIKLLSGGVRSVLSRSKTGSYARHAGRGCRRRATVPTEMVIHDAEQKNPLE